MRKTTVGWFGILLLLSGCAAEPFRAGRRIQAEGSFLTRTFTQDEKNVSIESMLSGLKQYDQVRDKISTGQIWYYSAMISGGVGGFLIGYNLVDSNSSSDAKRTGLLVGAGFVGLTVITALLADNYFLDGIDLYNKSHLDKNAAGIRLKPAFWLAKEQFSNSYVNPVLGVSISLGR